LNCGENGYNAKNNFFKYKGLQISNWVKISEMREKTITDTDCYGCGYRTPVNVRGMNTWARKVISWFVREIQIEHP